MKTHTNKEIYENVCFAKEAEVRTLVHKGSGPCGCAVDVGEGRGLEWNV